MEDFLIGVIKFIANFFLDFVESIKTKYTIIIAFTLLIVCFIIVYILIENH